MWQLPGDLWADTDNNPTLYLYRKCVDTCWSEYSDGLLIDKIQLLQVKMKPIIQYYKLVAGTIAIYQPDSKTIVVGFQIIQSD